MYDGLGLVSRVMPALWQPSHERIAATQLEAFRARAEAVAERALPDYAALHRWSVSEPEAFWPLVWETCEVRGERGERALVDADHMPGARFFPDARLSFAENLLRRDDEAPALGFRREDGRSEQVDFASLRGRVAAFAAALREAGVTRGDRVAGYVPNAPEAVIAMLAASCLGAVWSSCSPDFGVQGVVDRFGQIEPRVLVLSDGYLYGGRRFGILERLPAILDAVPAIERAVAFPYLDGAFADAADLYGAEPWDEFVAPHAGAALEFERLPFDHPLYVLYSSGTTGRPKCIVHGAGGTLLQHLKEHRLHVDLQADERFFYFTTCGWMMWNWLVSGLASGANLVLYDGSPFHPGPDALFGLAEELAVDVFGVSAKFLDAAAKAGLTPRTSHDLRMRAVLSTGSPLGPEGFDFVYERVRPDVHLASISGGTDIVSCFVGGVPTLPVHRGEIQGAGLGMDVAVFDDEGLPVEGVEGELVCRRPFPSMPVGFWNDPDGARYRAAYFERFPGVWCHGDWARRTEHGGFVITGRSDAVLNPGGVRIGTAEIYRPVERFDEVVEAIAVGQAWEGDVRVVLFVVLREGLELDDELCQRLRAAVRAQASPRHVPAVILQVPDIPRTRSGKITELAVRAVVEGRPVRNVEALANPEALDHFRDRPELR